MATLKISINPQDGERLIGHNKIAKKLKDHTPDELKLLAIEARRSNSKSLISYFNELPTLEELTEEKTDADLAKAQSAIVLNANQN